MAYNENLAERIRTVFQKKRVSFNEMKMMGGLCFMVKDKMCVGMREDSLMARIAPDLYENALTKKGCRKMDFTGRPMKGFVFVEPEGIDKNAELEYWVQLCIDFNPKAASSRKKSRWKKKK